MLPLFQGFTNEEFELKLVVREATHDASYDQRRTTRLDGAVFGGCTAHADVTRLDGVHRPETRLSPFMLLLQV
jgi:hypothetical protein